jgi:hypothetical protein
VTTPRSPLPTPQVASVTNVTAITGVLSFSVPDWPAASVGLCDSTTATMGMCDMQILLPATGYQLTRKTVRRGELRRRAAPAGLASRGGS